MHKFPDSVQSILKTISRCSKQNDVKVFLRGDFVMYALTGNSEFLQEQNIDLIISSDVGFNSHELYQCLVQNLIVNKEIENSSDRYHIVSSGYEIKIDLIYQFDPTRLTQAKRFGSFNLDLLFFDLETEELRHPPEVSDDPGFLENINHKNSWTFEDVLGFSEWMGTISEIQIDEDQHNHLKLLSLGTLKESLDITWEEQVEKILLLRRSGAALNFIAKTFADGMPWTFKVLIDYMISRNVGINEESDIETVFNEKKFEMIDSYNAFFLGDKKTKETADGVYQRLTMILKLLFDSPNLSIPHADINRIQTMAVTQLGRCCLGTTIDGNIAFFGCGSDISQAECALQIFCENTGPCLKEHVSFSHILEVDWQSNVITDREWCPDQVCPGPNPIHCFQSSSSSQSSSSQSSSSQSSSSQSSSSQSSSSQSSSSQSSSSQSSSSQSSSSSSSSQISSSSSSENLCTVCPAFDLDVSWSPVLNLWASTSGTLGSNGCTILRFNLSATSLQYRFTLGCPTSEGAVGAGASFPGTVELLDASCVRESINSDACVVGSNNQGSVVLLGGAVVPGNYYIVITETGGGSGGTFTLGYTTEGVG